MRQLIIFLLLIIEIFASPCFADQTTFTGETSDGYVSNQNADWTTCISAATGTSAGSGDNSIYNPDSNVFAGPSYFCGRAFIVFDTSALPDTAIISGGTIRLYLLEVNGEGDAEAYINFYQGTQGDTLETADFDAFTGGKLANDYDLTGLVISQYNEFGLTDLTTISKTGKTYFVIREGHDIEDNDPTTENNIGFRSANNADNKPQLVVTYTVPGTTGRPIGMGVSRGVMR